MEDVKLQASDGTFIEMFEWKSNEAKDRAHASATVMALWEQMMEGCGDDKLVYTA